MDDQPAPVAANQIACVNCKFARYIRTDPNSITKQLVCKLMPPHPVTMPTAQGPMLMGAVFPPVVENGWCFQFKPAEVGEVTSEAAPKLLTQQ